MSGTGYTLFPHSSNPEEEHHHLMNQPEILKKNIIELDIHRILVDKPGDINLLWDPPALSDAWGGVGVVYDPIFPGVSVWCVIQSFQVCRCDV